MDLGAYFEWVWIEDGLLTSFDLNLIDLTYILPLGAIFIHGL